MSDAGKRNGSLALAMSVFVAWTVAGMNFSYDDIYHRSVASLLLTGGVIILAGLLAARRYAYAVLFKPRTIIFCGISLVAVGGFILIVIGIT